MSTTSSFRAALAHRGAAQGEFPDKSDFRASKIGLTARKIVQPVDVALTLKRHGMSLRRAHDTLNRLAKGERVVVVLACDEQALAADLGDLGVEAIPIAASALA